MIQQKVVSGKSAFLAFFIFTAACTHQSAPIMEPYQPKPGDDPTAESARPPEERAPATPPPREERRQPSAAVQYLVAEAKKGLQNGNVALAQSHLERAFRIDNRDPWVSYYMSAVLLAQNDPTRAEQWAFQALSYFPELDRQSRRQTWELIASCRRQRGDLRGANEAQREADEYFEASHRRQ